MRRLSHPQMLVVLAVLVLALGAVILGPLLFAGTGTQPPSTTAIPSKGGMPPSAVQSSAVAAPALKATSATASSAAPLVATSAGTVSLANVAYGSDPQQVFDVLAPAAGAPAAVIIGVHGGEWYMGDKSETERVFGTTLLQNGYALVSINYRLVAPPPGGGPNQFPTAIRDLDCVLRTVRQNAAAYHIDPARIVLYGHSAGAQIAAMLAYAPEIDWHDPACPIQDQAPVAISGFFSGGAVFNFQDVPSAVLPVVSNELGSLYDAACAADRTREPCSWDVAEPVRHASSGDPPARLFTGDSDTTVNRAGVNNSADFAAALQAAGVPATAVTIPGGHKAFLSAFPTDVSVQQSVLEFLHAIVP